MKLHRQNSGLCLDISKRLFVSKEKLSCPELSCFLAHAMQVIGLDDHGSAF